MRIAFLHQPNDPYTQVRIKYFVSQGHDVYSIVFHKEKRQIPIPGVTIIPLLKKKVSNFPFAKRIIYAKKIQELTSENNIDVLYIISALNSYYLKASSAKKNILEIQGSDVILSPRRFPFLKLFYKYYWKYANGITQDSKLAQEKGLKYGASSSNNEVIEIGVNFSVFNKNIEKGIARKKLGIKDEFFVFSSRGMRDLYNIDIIIKAIPKVKEYFPNVKFVFAANYGELPKRMNSFINENNLSENILVTGWIDHDTEMPFYCCDADVVVSVPSSDSSPFSVYEAMATMTPVIVSDLPWLKDKFKSEINLITVPVKDSKALSYKIIEVLNNKSSINFESAYNIVYEKINMFTENKRLEMFINTLLLDD